MFGDPRFGATDASGDPSFGATDAFGDPSCGTTALFGDPSKARALKYEKFSKLYRVPLRRHFATPHLSLGPSQGGQAVLSVFIPNSNHEFSGFHYFNLNQT